MGVKVGTFMMLIGVHGSYGSSGGPGVTGFMWFIRVMLITMFIGVMGHGFGLLGRGEWGRGTRIIGFGHPGRRWDV